MLKKLGQFCLLLILAQGILSCTKSKTSKYKVVNGMKFHSFALDNKMEVLTISDTRFVKSTAALAVQAGSMDNPKEHMGLAHYLEHMLFLGTKEFPVIGEYEDFLNKNGGSHNAYTSMDHTNYFFDIDHAGLDGAMGRFSRFFVSPTFDEKYLAREKNAVNSEHEKNLKNDFRREHRFQQFLVNKDHPYSMFFTGDKNTLAKADKKAVVKFYNHFYSSNVMKLVIMSNKEPKDLENLAKKYFSDVPNKNVKPSKFEDKLFTGQKLPMFHEVESVRDHEVLKLAFNIPDDLEFWQFKPVGFIGELLGHEGEGSLLSYLKKQGLALGLSAGGGWRIFEVRVTLTEKGKKNYVDVMKAVFSYISMVKKEGIKEYVYDERKILAQVEFDNIEPQSSSGRSSSYSASMMYYPVDKFLERYYLYHNFKPEQFNDFLNYLRPDNLHVMLFSNKPKIEGHEPYYKIGYSSRSLDDKVKDELAKIAPYKEFIYPAKNPYTPTDFSLVTSKGVKEPVEKKIENKGYVFHQVDTQLEVPKGNMTLAISSDAIAKDPKKFLLGRFFSMVKKEELNEWGYPARIAGLNYSISFDYNTLTLAVDGYSQNLKKLLMNLIKDPQNNRVLTQINIDKEHFERIKKKFKKNLENYDYDAAYQASLYEYSNLLMSSSIHYKDYIQMVDKITIEEISAFAKELLKEVHLKMYAFGNIKPGELDEVVDYYYKSIGSTYIKNEDLKKFENKYAQIPEGHNLMAIAGKNNNNSMLSMYKLGDWSIENVAKISVLSKLIEQPYFTDLRTNQQLGYVVSGFGSSNNGFCSIGGLIQSQNTKPMDILKKHDVFFEGYMKSIAELKDKDIEMIKQALVNELQLTPNTLSERRGRFSTLAGSRYGDFKYYEKLTKQIKSVNAATLVSWLKAGYEKPSRMTILYYGTDTKIDSKFSGVKQITDYGTFKSAASWHQPYRESKNMK